MGELCPAFLVADCELAARDADAAVRRLCDLVSKRSCAEWVQQQPEWSDAQRRVQRLFRARAALEHTGLPLPADARAAAERAQADFARLGRSLSGGDAPEARNGA